MIKVVFFDLYGTLIDLDTDEHDPWVYSSLSRYLSYHSINISPELLKKTLFEIIETHLRQSKETYPEVDIYNVFSTLTQSFGSGTALKSMTTYAITLFRGLTIRRFRLFPGADDVLSYLAGRYKLGLISNAQWVFAEPEMKMLGLCQFFKHRVLSSHFGFRKPDERLFHIGLRRLMIKPEESIYIGDNPEIDRSGAERTGMKFILFKPEPKNDDDSQHDNTFSSYADLPKRIEQI
jgi:putative hydrolase of the HAD superfamily